MAFLPAFPGQAVLHKCQAAFVFGLTQLQALPEPNTGVLGFSGASVRVLGAPMSVLP
jgi:hypothetical protein